MLNLLGGADTQQKQQSPQQHSLGLQRSMFKQQIPSILLLGRPAPTQARIHNFSKFASWKIFTLKPLLNSCSCTPLLNQTYELKKLLCSGKKWLPVKIYDMKLEALGELLWQDHIETSTSDCKHNVPRFLLLLSICVSDCEILAFAPTPHDHQR